MLGRQRAIFSPITSSFAACRIALAILHAALLPAVLDLASPATPPLQAATAYVFSDGLCVLSTLSVLSPSSAPAGFTGGGPASEGSALSAWSPPTFWVFKALEVAYQGSLDRIALGTMAAGNDTYQVRGSASRGHCTESHWLHAHDIRRNIGAWTRMVLGREGNDPSSALERSLPRPPVTPPCAQIFWARNSGWALVKDVVYKSLSLGACGRCLSHSHALSSLWNKGESPKPTFHISTLRPSSLKQVKNAPGGHAHPAPPSATSGLLLPRSMSLAVAVTPVSGSVAACSAGGGSQRLAAITFDATTCPALNGVVAVALVDPGAAPGTAQADWVSLSHTAAAAAACCYHLLAHGMLCDDLLLFDRAAPSLPPSQSVIKGCGGVPDEQVSPWASNGLLHGSVIYCIVLTALFAALLAAGTVRAFHAFVRGRLQRE